MADPKFGRREGASTKNWGCLPVFNLANLANGLIERPHLHIILQRVQFSCSYPEAQILAEYALTIVISVDFVAFIYRFME